MPARSPFGSTESAQFLTSAHTLTTTPVWSAITSATNASNRESAAPALRAATDPTANITACSIVRLGVTDHTVETPIHVTNASTRVSVIRSSSSAGHPVREAPMTTNPITTNTACTSQSSMKAPVRPPISSRTQKTGPFVTIRSITETVATATQ